MFLEKFYYDVIGLYLFIKKNMFILNDKLLKTLKISLTTKSYSCFIQSIISDL